MDDPEFGHSDTDTEFGRELIEGFREVLAHMRGEIELPTAPTRSCPPPA